MIKKTLVAACSSLILLSLSLPVLAEFPRNWYAEGIQDFLTGNMVSTALHSDGALTLGAELKSLAQIKESAILDATVLKDGSILLGTSQEGAVYWLANGQAPQNILSLNKDMVTAVGQDKNGKFLAAAAPGARLYTGSKDGLKQIYKGKEGYIWDILTTAEGRTFFVTGNPGALYELKGEQAELLYSSKDSNLRNLYHDKHWGLLTGSGTQGVVYRYINNKLEALFEAGADEVTAITGDGKGNLFVAVNRDQAKQNQSKSLVFHIDPTGHSQILFNLDQETAYSLTLNAQGTLMIGTGASGRIYTIDSPSQSEFRKVSLPARSQSTQVSALLTKGSTVLAVGSSPSGLETYQNGYLRSGVYESEIIDAGLMSSWGSLRVKSLRPAGTEILAWTRTGNTSEPDETWSEWSKTYHNPTEVKIESPRGNYLQVKFELKTGDINVSPRLHQFEVNYLSDNLTPMVHNVFFLEPGVYFTPHAVGIPEGTGSLEINPQTLGKLQRASHVQDQYSQLLAERVPPTMRMFQKFKPGMMTLAWEAEDQNEDELLYDVYYQAYGQNQWILLAHDLNQSLYSFDSNAFADGSYRFRVVAKDDLANPTQSAKAFRDSELITLDNAAPQVKNLNARVAGQAVEVSFDAEDAGSPLLYAEYVLNGQSPQLLRSSDMIIDSQKESFRFKLALPAQKGFHSLAIKVGDRNGNVSRTQTQFEVR